MDPPDLKGELAAGAFPRAFRAAPLCPLVAAFLEALAGVERPAPAGFISIRWCLQAWRPPRSLDAEADREPVQQPRRGAARAPVRELSRRGIAVESS